MKKTFTIFVMLLLAVTSLQAQAIIHSCSLKETYLPYQWSLDTIPVSLVSRWDKPWGKSDLVAKYFYSKDSIKVYGIAVSLCNPNYDGDAVYSPSLDNAYEYFALYYKNGDVAVPISDSLKFHLRDTPVEYYLDIPLPSVPELPPMEPFPFYEKYFDTSYTVADSFLIGYTRRCTSRDYYDSATMQTYPFYTQPVFISGIHTEYFINLPSRERDKFAFWLPAEDAAISGVNVVTQYEPYYTMIYPILAPPPNNPIDTTHIDTTHIDTTHVDTVGIDVRLVERYTGLQPNPAAERVQVLSSFGLQHIEVFNAAGTKVQEQKATGYSATLDIRALPAGPYLVRIATPSGTVTKKLLVQRR